MAEKWSDVLVCVRIYKKMNFRNFKEGEYYLVCNGRLIDGNGQRSLGVYSGVDEINEAFYADFISL
ncbi:MAG: hypothetical protein K2G62_05750 [Oscillospiraceae bacterium]|nr:hypothetical protein [Oscillospiraceae bacterium]